MAGRLNPLEFAVAAASVSLKAKAKEAAKRVLVGGEVQADVAAAMGETRQNVYYWTKRILSMWERQEAAMALVAPQGWNVRIVTAPPDHMAKILALTEAERLRLFAGL